MTLTVEQREEVCPAVFGAHQWQWNETPVLATFRESDGAHLCDTYERTCRICMKHEAFDAPSPERR